VDFGLWISDYFEILFCLLFPVFNPQSQTEPKRAWRSQSAFRNKVLY
jgi:hypothetical protein